MMNDIGLNAAQFKNSLGTDRGQSAAQRFDALLSRTAAPAVSAQPSALVASFVLRVAGGLHQGATLRLRGRTRIGNAPDNDIVLHDPGVHPHHAELVRMDGAWVLFDVSDGREVRAIETARRGRFERRRFGLGAAELVLSQRAALAPAPAPKPAFASRRRVAAAALGLVIALTGAYAMHVVRSAPLVQASSTRSLATEGFPDVEVVMTQAGAPRVLGFVEDRRVLARLQHWLAAQDGALSQAAAQVQVGSELAGLVRETLADNSLLVDYLPGGVVRVQGSSSSLATRERLRRLSDDLAGVARIDSRVAFLDTPVAPAMPREHSLPVRVTDVMAGEHGSFSSGNGVRYFVGGVLPDGAEVIAIRDDAVEFLVGDKRITYFLK